MTDKEIDNKEIEALVKLAQNGDKDAFSKLYDTLIDPLYRYVYYRVDSAEAEDLIEIVFLKVWENICSYKPQKKSFSAWVFRIAHNLIVDHYRASKDRIHDELNPHLPDQNRQHNPIKNAQTKLDNELLKKAITTIKPEYQEVILYKFINELSNKEIAEILNKSEGSLRILQFRALKALKKTLEDMGISY